VQPTIQLDIGERTTRVGWAWPDGGEQAFGLPVGAAHPGVALRRHPPTAFELEAAIAAVEDVVMPLAHQLPPSTRLATDGAHARALQAWLQAGGEIAIEDVERAFDEMAAVALGRPQGHSGLPQDAAFDGWLLVLREFMHHCAFDRLAIEPAAP
jgi:hypothetical protein